jgi:hypothetical protein
LGQSQFTAEEKAGLPKVKVPFVAFEDWTNDHLEAFTVTNHDPDSVRSDALDSLLHGKVGSRQEGAALALRAQLCIYGGLATSSSSGDPRRLRAARLRGAGARYGRVCNTPRRSGRACEDRTILRLARFVRSIPRLDVRRGDGT